jgi:hypothetical protein
VTFVAAEQSGSTMRVEFSRPLAATNPGTDRAISASGPTTFLWALHETISPTSTTVYPKHTRRGAVTVNLGQASTCPPPGNDVKSIVDIDYGVRCVDLLVSCLCIFSRWPNARFVLWKDWRLQHNSV